MAYFIICFSVCLLSQRISFRINDLLYSSYSSPPTFTSGSERGGAGEEYRGRILSLFSRILGLDGILSVHALIIPATKWLLSGPWKGLELLLLMLGKDSITLRIHLVAVNLISIHSGIFATLRVLHLPSLPFLTEYRPYRFLSVAQINIM